MASRHADQQLYCEAALCVLHAAALAAEYLSMTSIEEFVFPLPLTSDHIHTYMCFVFFFLFVIVSVVWVLRERKPKGKE